MATVTNLLTTLNDTDFRTVTVNNVAHGWLNEALGGPPKNRGP